MSRRWRVAAAVVAMGALVACDGLPDRGYGEDGTVRFAEAGPAQVVPAADGGLVYTASASEVPGPLVGKLDRAGDPVPGWGALPAGTYADTVGLGLLEDAGRVVVRGPLPADPVGATRLVRLRADGTLDPSFGGDGIVDVASPRGTAITRLPGGGYLLLAVAEPYPSVPEPTTPAALLAVRLADDGAVLRTTTVPVAPPADPVPFPTGRPLWLTLAVGLVATPDGAVASLSLGADSYGGSVPGGGLTTLRYSTLVEVDAAGTLAGTGAGEAIVPQVGTPQLSVRPLPDGRRLVIRRNPDGSAPATLALDAAWSITPTSSTGATYASLAVLPCPAAQRVLVGGSAPSADGTYRGEVAAYDLATGALDRSFGTDGYATVPREGQLTQVVPLRASCDRFHTVTTTGWYPTVEVSRFWGPPVIP
jgi:hypothetical protein